MAAVLDICVAFSGPALCQEVKSPLKNPFIHNAKHALLKDLFSLPLLLLVDEFLLSE